MGQVRSDDSHVTTVCFANSHTPMVGVTITRVERPWTQEEQRVRTCWTRLEVLIIILLLTVVLAVA